MSAGSFAFGSWVLSAIAPVVYGDRLATVLSAVILFRVVAALGAISAGSFALAQGLVSRWWGSDLDAVRRSRGLTALGAASVSVGAFVMVGPFLGAGIAHSMAVVGTAALLAGASAWSAWVLRSPAPKPAAPHALNAPSLADEWVARDLGRVKTPAN